MSRTAAYHPKSNGIVYQLHRALKASLMCHNSPDWLSTLRTVLLVFRTAIQEDIECCTAELAYGTTLRIQGEFLGADDVMKKPKLLLEKFHFRCVLTSDAYYV